MSTFYLTFSTISNFSIFPKKAIGPDASENVLGRPEGFRELLGASGGGPGGFRERPGGFSEPSWFRVSPWSPLGAPLGALLEPSWAPLGSS